jgi:glycerol uptake facilitator-like aquaporin
VRLLIAVIGTASLGAVVSVLVMLARLTQKWEVVTKAKSYHRFYYLGAALVVLAALVRLLRIGYWSQDPAIAPLRLSGSLLAALYRPQSWIYVWLYYVPLAVGSTIGVWLTWRNWGWILREYYSRSYGQ